MGSLHLSLLSAKPVNESTELALPHHFCEILVISFCSCSERFMSPDSYSLLQPGLLCCACR